MKNLILLITLIFLFGCSTNNEIEKQKNLISNSTFEKANEFNLQNWTQSNAVSSVDVSNNGGRYSLQLTPGWFPQEGFAETTITNLEGLVLLNFSCDAKTIDWEGHILIMKEDINGVKTVLSDYSFDNNEWKNISFDINTNMVSNDLLIVHLTAGSTEVETGKVLFDNVVVTDY